MNQVEKLFIDNNISYMPSGKDYVIRCLNPEHPDIHPSLRISKLKGVGKCLSCGFSVNIFKYFNAPVDAKLIVINKLKEKINKLRSESTGLKIPSRAIPWNSTYRGIKVSTYKAFNAFEYKEEFGDRIIFPMYSASGKIVAFNGRSLDNETPRYKIYPAGIQLPLFPGKPTPINGILVLVEGIFDFLNLYDKGLTNTSALLGTNTIISKKGLNKDKVAILKSSGVTKIYLLLDGDDAGRKAMEELESALIGEGFFVDSILLDDGEDPGSLSTQQVNMLIKMLN